MVVKTVDGKCSLCACFLVVAQKKSRAGAEVRSGDDMHADGMASCTLPVQPP